MFEVTGKVAAITGSASGIGFAAAETLLAKGAKVIVSDYNEKILEKAFCLKEKYGDNVAFKAADVSKEEEVKALVDFAVETFGCLDIMVNNAGVSGVFKPVNEYEDSEVEVFKNVFEVNVYGVLYGTKYASKQMIKQGREGVIISTASIAGVIGGDSGACAYFGSKHAVLGLTKAWALELAPHDIRVNALCPAFTATGMVNADVMGQEAIDFMISRQPIGKAKNRLANVDEMAHALVYMIENTYVTGQHIIVDGGYTIQ